MVQVVLVILVALSLQSGLRMQDDSTEHWSAFCNSSRADCSYYPVPSVGADGEAPGAACGLAFPVERPKQSSSQYDGLKQQNPQVWLTLADFGLMSSLTYESPGNVARGLQHYFEGVNRSWYVEDIHEPSPGTSGWSTFYTFTDSENTTSVFAVQGTMDVLDVLQDVELWFAAATIYLAEFVGPSLLHAWAHAIVSVSNMFQLYTQHVFRKSFETVLGSVRDKIREHQSSSGQRPGRRFYITGHSLGGGIAKLVAEEVRYDGLALEDISFSAPGVAITYLALFGKRASSTIDDISVVPQNDIVSRLDRIEGAQIPARCNSNPLKCHSIFTTLCSLYRQCGSVLLGLGIGEHSWAGGRIITLPCGFCEDLPCPG
eukprot:TRINITY_DN42406_c0_g1_i1.p1 TRINITY_DN42406_c0_g1~~TRINITY_DN42406_c0_g1_i1.p1  ORF type:complete len:373 (+),score=50.20 TRINITY_DN42406_c0_g1_i1:753-1871(+)